MVDVFVVVDLLDLFSREIEPHGEIAFIACCGIERIATLDRSTLVAFRKTHDHSLESEIFDVTEQKPSCGIALYCHALEGNATRASLHEVVLGVIAKARVSIRVAQITDRYLAPFKRNVGDMREGGRGFD